MTIDRKVRKDAFYYYKANWNKEEPLVHLCSKGYSEREEPVADIVVFTTAPSATLNLNGKKLSTKKTDTYATVEWKGVELQEGANSVRIVTAVGEDTAVWNVRMR